MSGFGDFDLGESNMMHKLTSCRSIVTFLVIFIILFAIFYWWKPNWLVNLDGSFKTGMAFLWALIIAIILAAIVAYFMK